MDKIIYRNRYNDEVCFTLMGDHVILSGVTYVRAGFDDEHNYLWIDPSGGPFLSIGDNLGEFDDKLKEFTICSLNRVDDSEDWLLGGPMYKVRKKIKDYFEQ